MAYTLMEVTKRTGLTAHTIRYYDKEGLLPFIHKTDSGRRIFEESDIEWIELITCLKSTGMKIKDIRKFIEWYIEGDSTLQDRLAVFKSQKEQVERQIEDLYRHMEKINHKIHYYEVACRAGKEEEAKHLDVQKKC